MGKTLDNFDYVIFGHYHFDREHEVDGIKMRCLNGTGVAISDKTVYYLLDYKDGEISLRDFIREKILEKIVLE